MYKYYETIRSGTRVWNYYLDLLELIPFSNLSHYASAPGWELESEYSMRLSDACEAAAKEKFKTKRPDVTLLTPQRIDWRVVLLMLSIVRSHNISPEYIRVADFGVVNHIEDLPITDKMFYIDEQWLPDTDLIPELNASEARYVHYRSGQTKSVRSTTNGLGKNALMIATKIAKDKETRAYVIISIEEWWLWSYRAYHKKKYRIPEEKKSVPIGHIITLYAYNILKAIVEPQELFIHSIQHLLQDRSIETAMMLKRMFDEIMSNRRMYIPSNGNPYEWKVDFQGIQDTLNRNLTYTSTNPTPILYMDYDAIKNKIIQCLVGTCLTHGKLPQRVVPIDLWAYREDYFPIKYDNALMINERNQTISTTDLPTVLIITSKVDDKGNNEHVFVIFELSKWKPFGLDPKLKQAAIYISDEAARIADLTNELLWCVVKLYNDRREDMLDLDSVRWLLDMEPLKTTKRELSEWLHGRVALAIGMEYVHP